VASGDDISGGHHGRGAKAYRVCQAAETSISRSARNGKANGDKKPESVAAESRQAETRRHVAIMLSQTGGSFELTDRNLGEICRIIK